VSSTLEFFIARGKYKRRINEQFEPMLEAAIQQELQSFLLSMILRTDLPKRAVSDENISLFLSWAIFGSLIEWSKIARMPPEENTVFDIVSLCEEILV
jgi:hypothetical protein